MKTSRSRVGLVSLATTGRIKLPSSAALGICPQPALPLQSLCAGLEGQGLFTYIPLLDHLLTPETRLARNRRRHYFRGRHARLPGVLDYCQRQSIPTLYMLDDNWFWVGKDWPDFYASIFAPGLPEYEMFLTCLRRCDAVMVFATCWPTTSSRTPIKSSASEPMSGRPISRPR